MPYLFILLLGLWTTANAADLSGYLNIYDTAKSEIEVVGDEALLYERLESPVYIPLDRVLDDEEERAVVETLVSDTLNIGLKSPAFRDRILNQYNFEKDTLQLEKDLLARVISQPQLQDEREDNGAIDLIYDLNLIDQILFGSKWGRTNPKFAQNEAGLAREKEDWQIGDPRSVSNNAGIGVNLANPSAQYPKDPRAISAAIEDLKTHTEKLNSKPLNIEYPTKRFFEPGQAMAQMSPRINSLQRQFSTPEAFDTKPEVISFLTVQSPKDLIVPLITWIVTRDDKDYFSDLDRQLAATELAKEQDALIAELISLQALGVRRGGAIYDRDQQNYLYDKAVSHLAQHVHSMKTQVLEIQETLETFYDKPDR